MRRCLLSINRFSVCEAQKERIRMDNIEMLYDTLKAFENGFYIKNGERKSLKLSSLR